MKKEQVVEELSAKHAPAVAYLERTLFVYPWTEKQIAKGISSNALKVHGVHDNGELVGYIAFYAVGGVAEIVNIGVLPECRRCGFGRALLRRMITWCRETDMEQIFLEVRETNTPAITLYTTHGFEQTGVRPKYYPDTKEDALVMALELKG